MPNLNDGARAVQHLYPDLDATEVASAAEALDRYIEVVARIAERIAGDPVALDGFCNLTRGPGTPTMTDTSSGSSDQ